MKIRVAAAKENYISASRLCLVHLLYIFIHLLLQYFKAASFFVRFVKLARCSGEIFKKADVTWIILVILVKLYLKFPHRTYVASFTVSPTNFRISNWIWAEFELKRILNISRLSKSVRIKLICVKLPDMYLFKQIR